MMYVKFVNGHASKEYGPFIDLTIDTGIVHVLDGKAKKVVLARFHRPDKWRVEPFLAQGDDTAWTGMWIRSDASDYVWYFESRQGQYPAEETAK